MFIYLLIYIPFLLSSYFDFAKTPKKLKNQVLWFWVVVFTLFRGLRWKTGTDWDQFCEVYYHAHWNNIFSYYRYAGSDQLMDYGYMFINAIFNEAGLPYTIFLLVTNFFIMWCFMDFSRRHSKYPVLTLIMLMNVGVPFPVRQTIAMAMSLWGFRFAIEKKYIIYACVAFCAALIHKGSLISIVILGVPYILSKIRIKWWMYAGFYAATMVIAKILQDYLAILITLIAASNEQLDSYSSNYLGMESTSVDYGDYNGALLSGLSFLLFFAMLLFMRERYGRRCRQSVKKFEVFFFLYALSASIQNLLRQGESSGLSEIVGRVTSTIDMFPIIFPLMFTVLMPKLISMIHPVGKPIKRNIIFGIFVLYMGYKFWKQIPGSFFYELFIPYHSVF